MLKSYRYRSAIILTIAAATTCGLSGRVHANDYWTNAAGGAWETGANWSSNAPPLLDQAVFNLPTGTPYTTTISTAIDTNSTTVQDNNVTLSLGSNSLTSHYFVHLTADAGKSSSLTLNGTSTPNIYNVRTDGGFTADGAGSTTFTVDGLNLLDDSVGGGGGFKFGAGCSVNLNNATLFSVSGGMSIADTAVIDATVQTRNDVSVSSAEPAGAILNLDGSVFSQNGNITVGQAYQKGTANLSYGYLTAGKDLLIGDSGVSSVGTINLNVGLINAENIDVGGSGTGVLNLSGNYSTVQTLLGIVVGAGGTLRVNKGGAVRSPSIDFSKAAFIDLTGGTLDLFDQGRVTDPLLTLPAMATLLAENAATLSGGLVNNGIVQAGFVTALTAQATKLTVDGSYTQSANGVLDILLGGNSLSSKYVQLNVLGAASLDGTLEIDLATGFDPQMGQSFHILGLGTEVGAFSTLDLPALDPGLIWNTQQLYTSGVISVVPEPTAIGIAGLSALAMLGRRGRRVPPCL